MNSHFVVDGTLTGEGLQAQRHQVETAVTDAFVRHAIENRGILTSPRRGANVAARLFDLLCYYLDGQAGDTEITLWATELVEQGLALATAAAMMRALTQAVSPPSPHLTEFHLLFLEKVAVAREGLQHSLQEQSQAALQRALHHQLEQQIASHTAQTRQNERLNAVLQLTTRLSLAADEQTLLAAAAAGLSEALSIPLVTLYRYEPESTQWRWTGSSAVDPDTLPTPAHHITLLQQAQAGSGEMIQPYQQPESADGLAAALILQVGGHLLGGIIADSPQMTNQESEPFLLLLRAFAQNLAALWQNLRLLAETKQRTQELEILHGRYLDTLWQSEHALLQAQLADDHLRLNRHSTPGSTAVPSTAAPPIPLKIGDYTFGQVHLPNTLSLSPEDEEFVEVLVREMGSALSNAQFLQTARAYSNQLSLAADVSRAATTILDRETLITEAVELIRSRFNFYYVGLFLLDEEGQMAVLHAGTGTAGAQMVAESHQLVVGGHSMVGTAVATGKPRVEQDVSRASRFIRNPHLPETKAELALPLRARGRTIGALTVQSKETGAFNPESITALQSLADQLGVAIENASLFAQTQRNLAESNLLYETSRRINQASTPNQVYQALVDFAAQSGLVDLAQMFVPDPGSQDYLISPVFWSKLGVKHNPQHRFSRDKFQATNLMETDQIIRIEDGPNQPDLDAYTRALFTNNGVRAATLVPVFAEQTWLGTLALDRVAPVPLNDQELQPFITLAAQAAINLANQQLLRQTETLYHIGRLLNQSITREDALEITAREIARYVGAVQCRVVLYDHQQKIGMIAAEYGNYDYGDKGAMQLPAAGDYVLARLQQQPAPLLLAEGDGQTPETVLEQHVRPFGARASLLIPAANMQEVMGFLAIDSRRGTRPFTPANIIFAQTVVDQLVTQLENLKLLDEALQRAQELITLNQIQTTISYYLELNELAQAVYQQVGRLLDNTIFSLARYDAQTRLYTPILHVVEGIKTETHPRTLQPDEPLCLFLQQEQHHLVDGNSPLTRFETRPLARPPRSGLWIPMQREGKANGLISVQSYDAQAYNENDVQLLRSIATQANLALANAELFTRIQAHNEELMQLDQLKTQFLANMSHELRTPLNSIIGFSRVILKGIDGPISPEQEEDLTSIYKNGQHLLSLINEILDMAKIEAGKMTLSFEEVDMAQAAEAVHSTVRGLIDPAKIELLWEVQPGLPLIEADPTRVRQILLNLLSNAAKYTPEGHIQLKILQENEHVHIVVHDTGIGIAEADFEKVFVPFEQADSSTTRAVGGTGLGLPITKWLVEMHQGEIYFESELDKGSTFHILLPLRMEKIGD
ncbi:MAG: GAF domain-containing protein [Anaerolineae bacterium]|nr:GAF domain-containing protein [Anaerolineae bacterium]